MSDFKINLQCSISDEAKKYAKTKAKMLKISLSQYIDLLIQNSETKADAPQNTLDNNKINEIWTNVGDIKMNMNRGFFSRIFG